LFVGMLLRKVYGCVDKVVTKYECVRKGGCKLECVLECSCLKREIRRMDVRNAV
jgi:hypothetical protein